MDEKQIASVIIGRNAAVSALGVSASIVSYVIWQHGMWKSALLILVIGITIATYGVAALVSYSLLYFNAEEEEVSEQRPIIVTGRFKEKIEREGDAGNSG